MFDVHLLIRSMFIILSFNHLWISMSSFNEALAFFVLHSTFDVGRSMFDVRLLNRDHLDPCSPVQPFGVDTDLNQAVGFYHCVYKP